MWDTKSSWRLPVCFAPSSCILIISVHLFTLCVIFLKNFSEELPILRLRSTFLCVEGLIQFFYGDKGCLGLLLIKIVFSDFVVTPLLNHQKTLLGLLPGSLFNRFIE